MIDKIVTHSKYVLNIAIKRKWFIGARYTNLRDVSSFNSIHFIDIDWKNYNFSKHLEAVKKFKPKYTVAKDWEKKSDLKNILNQASILSNYCENVIIVPKVDELKERLISTIPKEYF